MSASQHLICSHCCWYLEPTSTYRNGNTHVTITWACLLGDSRSQRVRAFSYILIKYLIVLTSLRALIIVSTSSRAPQISFPAHPLLSFPHYIARHIIYAPNIHVYSVEEVRWKGFILPLHRPSPRGEVDLPSTSSAHPVDYRLEQSSHLLANCANTNKNNIGQGTGLFCS